MEKSFEEMLNELEGLIKELESNDILLEDAIDKYKKSMDLANQLKKKLENAKEQFEIKE